MIHIARDGNQLGQFPESEVREGLLSGRFLPGDLAWKTGMSEWIPLSALGLSDSSGPVPPAAAGAFPWEQRSQTGLFKAALETIKGIFSAPQAAFTSLGNVDSIGSAFLFFALTAFPFLYIGTLWSILSESIKTTHMQGPTAGLTAFAISAFSMLFLVPVILIVSLFLSSGLIHLALMLLGGARQGFAATFSVLSYSQGAAAPCQVVPVCGAIVGPILSLIFSAIGLKKVHDIPTWKAVLAILSPVLFCCACAAVFGLLGLALLGDHLQEIFKQIEAQVQAQAAASAK
jgi:hypothetical protein